MTGRIIGIDLGHSGALALIDEGELVAVVDMPTLPGPVGAFAFGRARGAIEGCLGALAVPIVWLTVPTWRRAVGLPVSASKDHGRAAAIPRWPAFPDRLPLARGDGRAESALIA